ncbi:CoA transferase [Paludibacterium sp. B53371]|uniref:CoA transferase n=1 Tax=Paludibacterium sp. B53371 TaxID=2806263 RepID=UPI001C05D6B3|nr:CoA transferase [Paludibacterium sp. B53371]
MSTQFSNARHMLQQFWLAAQGDPAWCDQVDFVAEGQLPSCYPVTDLAAAAVASATLALAEWRQLSQGLSGRVEVDRRLASLWFASSIRPQGWALPPSWDALAGDYATRDGWIRLHTNAPHHRQAALQVLAVTADRAAVEAAVSGWAAESLEAAVVAAGGCAAVMRSQQDWERHPQGRALAREPLLAIESFHAGSARDLPVDPQRPLAGVRVLDLTRVIAGPVATRFLAAAGAEVLRIDPPGWHEPWAEQELTPGKRTARLDLKSRDGLEQLCALLSGADILVHGYRADALAALGLDAARRRVLQPGLIEVALDAYGWSGPWALRRGFDSLVQMSCGIAEAGMRLGGKSRPTPLPVQALDHATGYLLACAALRGLSQRRLDGQVWRANSSLARVACCLQQAGTSVQGMGAAGWTETGADWADYTEQTAWGAARRLRMPAQIDGFAWPIVSPAGALGSDTPVWHARNG